LLKIDSVEKIFALHTPAYFINCAAYTAVDKAETEQEAAYTINAEAPGNIASLCKKNKTCLIHLSTDYVFNGQSTMPYKETDATQPINYYGYTKCLGEELALQNNEQTIVIRTSWVYSKYGNNFVKTMLRLMNERAEINVVNDQHGSPTYAKDIAKAIMQIVSAKNFQKGIYHFSNEGIISWFDFACAIRQIKHLQCKVNPIASTAYPTPAKRPFYSGLDKNKNYYRISHSIKKLE